MTTESRNYPLLGNIPEKAKGRNNRRTAFSVVSAALVATQRCSKHISAAVNNPQQ
jgi:hypothetical protein